MPRTTSLLAAAIGLPLLLAGCGDDAVPPSGPRAETPAPAARVAAKAMSQARYQVKDRAANATFSTLDPSGCVETTVFVFGSLEAVKDGPGKPTRGPLAVVRLTQFDFCNFTIGEYFGITEDAAFEVGRQLDRAHLKASVPGFLDETGVEAEAVVDLTWTGAGDTFSETLRDRQRFPGATLTQWFKGVFRPAQVSGTVVIGKTNYADAPLDALIIRATQGTVEMVRTR
ncbi:MAG TPA: hypothetical protein VEB59_14375 [Gemmatimonadales bacterium]|nr:hypothetical protein [Gemmatimonadales bacterium]